MNNNAKEWIKALRSEKYNQGTGRLIGVNLNREYEYCCLGVACELYKKNTNIDIWNIKDEIFANSFLPRQVMEWLGLQTNVGVFTDNDSNKHDLVTINDTLRCDFHTIADIIEGEPPNLFIR